MIYQLVWATKDEIQFEQTVPLLWHGEFMARQGWKNNIKIGFMEGISRLSTSYLKDLERVGYEVFDCSSPVKRLLEEYPQLNKYDTTNKYWFLRWNVLDLLARDIPSDDTIVHLDADVVLLADPKEIYKDVKGKTFVLQGCPVLTAISEKKWFEVWRTELKTFLEAPEAYQREALKIKEEPIKDPRAYCNTLAYGPGRFHDQDMLEYLISAGKLPQAKSKEVFDSKLYWIQNPLLPGEWHKEQCEDSEKRVVVQQGKFFVGEKQIPFYHFQSDFAIFCGHWLLLDKFGLSSLSTTGHLRTGIESFLGKIMIMKALRYLNRGQIKKLEIQEAVFQENPRTGNLYITDITNRCWG